MPVLASQNNRALKTRKQLFLSDFDAVRYYSFVTYLTITGTRQHIELPDQTYGEWIVYERGKPKYHIDCFGSQSASNVLIKHLIQSKRMSIEDMLTEINKAKGSCLSLGKKPMVRIVLKRTQKKLQLDPLPVAWVKQLTERGQWG